MTSGEYPNNPDPNFPPPPPGGYPPPPPPQQGAYPPPPQYGAPQPPQYGAPQPPQYGAPQYGVPQYGDPQYGAPGGYPPAQYGPVGGAEPGGLGIRFAARFIDGLIVGIVSFLLAFAFGSADNILVTGLFSGLLTFGYFVAFEVTQGWTPAKKMLGLSVRGPGGAAKPDFKQSAIRNSFTVLAVIPYIGGLLGFIAYIVIAVTINGSPTKQGKHDQLAGGTQVVKG